MNKDLNSEIADLGARQFVRNKILDILKECAGSGQEANKIINDINNKLVADFVIIARDESSKLFKQITEGMAKLNK